MSRTIQLNLALTPVFNYDSKTDQFTVYYEEFSEAIAVGETEEEAEKRLIKLVEVMWADRPAELNNKLLSVYANSEKIKKSSKLFIA